MLTHLKKLIVLSIFFPAISFAQTAQNNCGGDPSSNQLMNPLKAAGICNLLDLMSWLTNLLTFFVGLFAVTSIILAGYGMVMGGGDPEKLKESKDKLFWSIVGLITVLLAYSIVKVILNLINNSQV